MTALVSDYFLGLAEETGVPVIESEIIQAQEDAGIAFSVPLTEPQLQFVRQVLGRLAFALLAEIRRKALPQGGQAGRYKVKKGLKEKLLTSRDLNYDPVTRQQ